MMKFKIVLLLFLSNYLNLNSQTFDTTFVKQVGYEICDCLSKQSFSTGDMGEYFYAFQNLCAVEILNDKYIHKLDEFQAETKKNGTNISVNNMFYEFFNLAQVVMVDDCDLVFNFYEAQQSHSAQIVKDLYATDAYKILAVIDEEIEKTNQLSLITLRGLNYFSIDSLRQAELDLKPAIEDFDMKHCPNYQLYAHILELNGKLDEAIAFYEEIIVKQPIPFEFYLAVTKRKKREAMLEKN